MIRVLHVVTKMDRGGQETFIMNVFRRIDRARVSFDFLCTKDEPADYDDEIRALGGRIFYMTLPVRGGKFTKYRNRYQDQVRFLKPLAAGYDVVHLHNYHAFDSWLDVKAFRQAGFRHVILHSHNSCAPHPRLHKIFRRLLSRDQKVVRFACSEEAGRWMHGKRPFAFIPNGIDTVRFRYDPDVRERVRKAEGWEGAFVVGHVGRFNYQKNHTFLLEIFAELVKREPNAVLALVGKGELESEIREKAQTLGISESVRFLGTRTDVDALMSAFDVFALPSLFEGLALVVIETQCASLPMIASDVISPLSVIGDGIRLLPLSAGAPAWADAIASLKDADRTAIRFDASGFDSAAVAADLLERYAAIAGK